MVVPMSGQHARKSPVRRYPVVEFDSLTGALTATIPALISAVDESIPVEPVRPAFVVRRRTTGDSSLSRNSSAVSQKSDRKKSTGNDLFSRIFQNQDRYSSPFSSKGIYDGNPFDGAYSKHVNWSPIYPSGGKIYSGFGGGNFSRGLGLGGLSIMHFLTTALKSLEPRIDDDFIDRLNYYYTPTILIIFAILVSAKQYVGHPIECWVPATFTKAMEQYSENYCWIQNTYYVPFEDGIPPRIDERVEKQIGYYQWVPFILAIQALMFYIPAIVWRMLNTQSGINVHGILQMASDDHNIEPENRSRTIAILSRHIDDALQYQRDYGARKRSVYLWFCMRIGKYYGAYVSLLYCFIKLLYSLNVVGQFLLLNRFLEIPGYPYFGARVVWDMLHGIEWEESGKFPRVTLCDFQIRVLGNIHRHTVQCVLVINMFTEKVFIFLWLWLGLLLVLSGFSLLYWLANLMIPPFRVQFMLNHLELSEHPPNPNPKSKAGRIFRKFVLNFLRPDGIFILRMIGAHAGTVLCTEIGHALWAKFKARTTLRLSVSAASEPKDFRLSEKDDHSESLADNSDSDPASSIATTERIPSISEKLDRKISSEKVNISPVKADDAVPYVPMPTFTKRPFRVSFNTSWGGANKVKNPIPPQPTAQPTLTTIAEQRKESTDTDDNSPDSSQKSHNNNNHAKSDILKMDPAKPPPTTSPHYV